jgi:hypothetical protein
MVSCLEVLEEEGESLKGYSSETIAELSEESLPYDECQSLLALYEVIYG